RTGRAGATATPRSSTWPSTAARRPASCSAPCAARISTCDGLRAAPPHAVHAHLRHPPPVGHADLLQRVPRAGAGGLRDALGHRRTGDAVPDRGRAPALALGRPRAPTRSQAVAPPG